MLESVLFDCDGVVVDSEGTYLASVCDHLGELGVSVSPNDIAGLVGMRTERILKQQRTWFPVLADLSDEEILTRQRALFAQRRAREGLKLFPGLRRVLDFLSDRGVSCALVSSSPRSYLDEILDGNRLRPYFSVVVSGEEVHESKPSPEIYLKALAHLKVPAERAIAIEDSPNGIRAALAAGLETMGFKGSALLLDTSAATWEASSYDEVGERLQALFG